MTKKNIISILIIGIILILGLFLFQEEIGRELKKIGFNKENKEEIEILNVHSHPKKGEGWTVFFQTEGIADLKIIPGDLQTINDLEFVSLSCGDKKIIPQVLDGDILFYPNWSCDKATGSISHLVKIARNHNLKISFGEKISQAFNSPDSWLEIDSSNILDYSGGAGLEDALDGRGIWINESAEEHWFRLDFGSSYNITAVRGRSNLAGDPINVDIYVSDNYEEWGDPVAEGISVFRDTTEWAEAATTPKEGQYMKVVVIATETGEPGNIEWGDKGGMTIFDAYEGAAATTTEYIDVEYQEWSTSSSWSYGSGTDLTSATSTAVELDLPKPISRFATSADDIYWGIGIPSTTSLGTYSGTTTFEAKAD